MGHQISLMTLIRHGTQFIHKTQAEKMGAEKMQHNWSNKLKEHVNFKSRASWIAICVRFLETAFVLTFLQIIKTSKTLTLVSIFVYETCFGICSYGLKFMFHKKCHSANLNLL